MSIHAYTKAARLLVIREILTDWPDCPSAYLARAFGVHVRTIERYLLDLLALNAESDVVRAQVLAHRDPDWISNEDACRRYGWSAGYLDLLAKRLPDARRHACRRRLWSRLALDAYVAGEPQIGSRSVKRGYHRKTRSHA